MSDVIERAEGFLSNTVFDMRIEDAIGHMRDLVAELKAARAETHTRKRESVMNTPRMQVVVYTDDASMSSSPIYDLLRNAGYPTGLVAVRRMSSSEHQVEIDAVCNNRAEYEAVFHQPWANS
jgi:hypothetical protein